MGMTGLEALRAILTKRGFRTTVLPNNTLGILSGSNKVRIMLSVTGHKVTCSAAGPGNQIERIFSWCPILSADLADEEDYIRFTQTLETCYHSRICEECRQRKEVLECVEKLLLQESSEIEEFKWTKTPRTDQGPSS